MTSTRKLSEGWQRPVGRARKLKSQEGFAGKMKVEKPVSRLVESACLIQDDSYQAKQSEHKRERVVVANDGAVRKTKGGPPLCLFVMWCGLNT